MGSSGLFGKSPSKPRCVISLHPCQLLRCGSDRRVSFNPRLQFLPLEWGKHLLEEDSRRGIQWEEARDVVGFPRTASGKERGPSAANVKGLEGAQILCLL